MDQVLVASHLQQKMTEEVSIKGVLIDTRQNGNYQFVREKNNNLKNFSKIY